MDLSEYQRLAARTMNRRLSEDKALHELLGVQVVDPDKFDKEFGTLGMLLGIAGELGELAEAFKHHYFHGVAKNPLDETNVREETGDLLWYLAGIATRRKNDLGEVGEENIGKLQRRYGEAFSTEASLARRDKAEG